MSKAKQNATALQGYLDSLCCGVSKAEHGSNCEDMYILEKLEKFANRMGYNITKVENDLSCDDCKKCGETTCGNDINMRCFEPI